MNEYRIPHTSTAQEWSCVPTLNVDNILWLPDAGVRMSQQICYDDSALYVHQYAIEQNIRAELTDPLSQVCEDSCMEFFFCPDPNSVRYFNFEWNLNGCLYLGLNDGHGCSVRLHPENICELFNFRATRTHDGWELYYQIPQNFIQLFFPEFRLRAGVSFRANCYKCGDLTDHPHYMSWNPCTSLTPCFHRPCDFGIMYL